MKWTMGIMWKFTEIWGCAEISRWKDNDVHYYIVVDTIVVVVVVVVVVAAPAVVVIVMKWTMRILWKFTEIWGCA
jgi:hypothetical protein